VFNQRKNLNLVAKSEQQRERQAQFDSKTVKIRECIEILF
jgi:hypothetical protein